MNLNQKLRYIINLYGDYFGIDDFYLLFKKSIGIKRANDLPDDIKIKYIEQYQLGIKQIEEGLINISEERERLEAKYF